MSSTHWIIQAIDEMEGSYVRYGCEFMEAVLKEIPFNKAPPAPKETKISSSPIIPKKSLFLRILSFLKKLFKRNGPYEFPEIKGLTIEQRLDISSDRVIVRLKEESKMVSLNIAMHNVKVLDNMLRLVSKWCQDNILVVVQESSAAGRQSENNGNNNKYKKIYKNTQNFINILFTPCGFLSVLAAAEAYFYTPGSSSAVTSLAAIYKRMVLKQQNLKTGDIILLRVMSKYLLKLGRTDGHNLYISQLREFDTLKRAETPTREFTEKTMIKWWGLTNCIAQYGSIEPINMNSYICQQLLDEGQKEFSRNSLSKWSSCFKTLLNTQGSGKAKDIENDFLNLSKQQKADVKRFCDHFLIMFKILLKHECIIRTPSEDRKSMLESNHIPVRNYFTTWLSEDLNRYIDDFFRTTGDTHSHQQIQKLEEEYNDHYKYVFAVLSRVTGQDELLANIENIRYGR